MDRIKSADPREFGHDIRISDPMIIAAPVPASCHLVPASTASCRLMLATLTHTLVSLLPPLTVPFLHRAVDATTFKPSRIFEVPYSLSSSSFESAKRPQQIFKFHRRLVLSSSPFHVCLVAGSFAVLLADLQG
ncbi:hypothetical protein PIB30_087636 [Stylosanthes scabra]|uniref:Uncharacterized protein n=1 Tax=Stylosanthes scabra TaxID=79078 RepID=A0ABU6SUC1_9FABA|nr:hypothetical protein [Stylosanthes scabra]